VVRCRSGLRLLRKFAFGLEPVPRHCRSLVYSGSLRLTSHSSRTRFVAAVLHTASWAGRLNSGVRQQMEIGMTALSKTKQIVGLLAWLAVSFVASGIGAVASIRAVSFYGQIVQPSWAPPSSVFGPVWTILYALMGIAAWMVWRVGGFRANRPALTLFLVQLAVNASWSWLFFAWHRGDLAFADIVLLWLLIIATLVSFWRARPVAGALFIPYLLWVSFAAALNFSVWQLNPQFLG
jgi:benzodiazapine receptor